MPSLLEAIERKYGGEGAAEGRESVADEEESAAARDISVSIYVPRRTARACVPSLLVLNNCDIDGLGADGAPADLVGTVEELDLAMNRLCAWDDVLHIMQQMPRLRFVNLSFNRLEGALPGGAVAEGADRWRRLDALVLNATRVPWGSVRALLAALPALQELHLSLNGYEAVQLPAGERHAGLRRLHFTGNPVRRWAEACKLGRAFPALETLALADCPLESLSPADRDPQDAQDAQEPDAAGGPGGPDGDDDGGGGAFFRNVRCLNLDGTRLRSWADVDRLAAWPALRALRVRGCPLWREHAECTEHERRQLLIARLPAVEVLNGGGAVSAEEREAAERAFVRRYAERPEADRPARLAALQAAHGPLQPLAHVDLRPEKRVRVLFTCVAGPAAAAAAAGSVSETRAVDVCRTVADLKARLERLSGLPAAAMRLFYVDQELRGLQGPEEMRFPHKRLHSYNMRSGDEIIVDCKPARAHGAAATPERRAPR